MKGFAKMMELLTMNTSTERKKTVRTACVECSSAWIQNGGFLRKEDNGRLEAFEMWLWRQMGDMCWEWEDIVENKGILEAVCKILEAKGKKQNE